MSRLIALCATAATTSSVLADQILEIDDATLTTYVATAKSGIQDVRPLVDQRGVNIDGSLRGDQAAHVVELAEDPCEHK